MATIKRFEEILVWQEAKRLAVMVYATTSKGIFAKDFGLKDQIQRAAVSVSSNIAEGFSRSGNKEFANFLWIAKGSVAQRRSSPSCISHGRSAILVKSRFLRYMLALRNVA